MIHPLIRPLSQQQGLVVLLLFLLAAGAPAARAQGGTTPDTSAGTSADIGNTVRTPRGALWRAALAPGWGQVYNEQYYKLPFVYGGLGGLVATALWMNDRYLLYRHAYLYAIDPDAYARYADDAAPFTRLIASGQQGLLRLERDKFRRNRDLFYIGVGLFYGLTVLDAYVSAHLLDFDVSEDLSMRIYPAPGGTAAVLRITF